MARLSTVALVLLLVVYLCHGSEARKLSSIVIGKGKGLPLKGSLVLNVLPKGPTSPSGGGNEITSNINVHLGRPQRFLVESVPSPGEGHLKFSSSHEENF
ncbi:hypothetical protein JCGZ_13469 [Jatropha curcas]|uniref:Uncharacterized protein n=1 Tax=Jatropha curcas TaxID=180498 RepID=A0A067LFJ2_JATCU|nr:hypothetical protein JCGZ_13469 [Jatropha curcas]